MSTFVWKTLLIFMLFVLQVHCKQLKVWTLKKNMAQIKREKTEILSLNQRRHEDEILVQSFEI